jgi:hypothetical protein
LKQFKNNQGLKHQSLPKDAIVLKLLGLQERLRGIRAITST